MGYLDRFAFGKKAKEPQTDDAASASSPPVRTTPEMVLDSSPSTSGSYSSSGPPSIGAAGSMAAGMGALGVPASGARLYDPYEGIHQQVGVRKQLFKLPSQPEFLFEEEASVRRRGWGESLQFYVGCGYILGESFPRAAARELDRPSTAQAAARE